MSDLQKQIQQAIDQLVESEAELGLQVAVYRRGEQIVDAVAGIADRETGRPVTSDTLFYSTSTGKSTMAAVVHVLAERGVLGYDTPIAEVWPEFGAHGKDKATVRHLLAYQLGVPGVPAGTTLDDFADMEKITAALADSEPWWEPGTKIGYHPQTFGFILSETVRRATGKPLSQVLREEISEPLGIANELYVALPESELGRLAKLEEGGEPIDPVMLEQMMPLYFKICPLAVQPSADYGNDRRVLTSEGAGASLTARAVARLYAAMLDEVDGVRLVSPARVGEIASAASEGEDQIFGQPVQYALGYSLGRPLPTQPSDPTTVFSYLGAGGSYAEGDTATGISFAMTKNKFTGGDFSTADKVASIIDEHSF